MQLKNKTNLKALLTSATCALISGNSAAQDVSDENWEFDTAIMQYAELERVMATEAIIAAKKTYGDDEVLNLNATIDVLTGASPTGAVAQPTPETYTRPSGNGQYITPANETPLDDTFKDTRLQLSAQWTQPLLDHYTVSVGGNISNEYDYLSLSVNTNVARDFDNKNTTLSFGMAYAHDVITPEGGIPKPGSAMVIGDASTASFSAAFDETRLGKDDTKSTVDLLFGLTQVINRYMVVQLNYSYSTVNGYLNDPFKVISLVNAQGQSQQQLFESRPDERTKHAIFAQTKYHFDAGILDASYRFMTDDWDINSHTVDVRYLIPLSDGHFIEPHIRVYNQSAAEFYQPFLKEGDVLPDNMSADYRIGDLDTFTVGLKYGFPMRNGDKLAFRFEYYNQAPKNNGTATFGVLNNVELFEKVDAFIAQVTYSF